MTVSTAEVLAPKTILKAVQQMDLAGTSLQRLLGFGLGSGNVDRQSGRNFAFDSFPPTRRIATARFGAQASGRQRPQAVTTQSGTFPRAAETISLLDEDLLNRRRIGRSPGELDRRGENYLTRQEAYLAQRFANLVEFQAAAMLRGSYSYHMDGDDLRHGFTGGTMAVDFAIPAGNLGQLNMLGGGNLLNADWSVTTTDIPRQLQAINAAMVQLTGMGLAHVIVTGTGWQNIINNQKVQTQGGSAASAFESLSRQGSGEFSARLKALPWITFHVVDYGLEVWNGTSEVFTKLIADDSAAFLPEPSVRWVQYLEGSEMVTEGPGGVKGERFGFYAYAYSTHDPSGWDLCAVMNGIPALYMPSAAAYGKISGGVY